MNSKKKDRSHTPTPHTVLNMDDRLPNAQAALRSARKAYILRQFRPSEQIHAPDAQPFDAHVKTLLDAYTEALVEQAAAAAAAAAA